MKGEKENRIRKIIFLETVINNTVFFWFRRRLRKKDEKEGK